MARPKLADVAKLAGVGIGTASDALAGKNRIPDETRRRVREAADALGYVPNPVARALSAGHLPVIGIVITALRYPAEFEPYRTYWGELIGATSLAAVERGYAVTVLPGLDAVMSSALPVAGLIVITAHAEDDDVDRALRLGVPVVGDGFVEDPRASAWVDLNYGAAAPIVMDHFVDVGARRPALLWGISGDEFLVKVRDAYLDWCSATGHAPLEASSDPSNEHVGAAIDALLDSGADAIFTVVESVPEIVNALDARGLELGTDVRLVTLDEDISGQLAETGISTIGLTGRHYADEVVGALLDVVEGKVRERTVIYGNPTLHPATSSKGPRRR